MSIQSLVALTEALQVVCPLNGVLMRDESNPATWTFAPAPSATAQQIAAATALLATLTPAQLVAAAPINVSYLQFRALFTAAEKTAIMEAAPTNPAVLDWLLQAAGVGTINLCDPLVATGLAELVTAGLLTSARSAAIIANQPAPAAPTPVAKP